MTEGVAVKVGTAAGAGVIAGAAFVRPAGATGGAMGVGCGCAAAEFEVSVVLLWLLLGVGVGVEVEGVEVVFGVGVAVSILPPQNYKYIGRCHESGPACVSWPRSFTWSNKTMTVFFCTILSQH